MQCGVNPRGFFVSSCLSMCHRPLCHLFSQVFLTVPRHTSLVCLEHNWIDCHSLKIPLLLFCPVKTAQIGNFNTCAVTINNIPLIFTTHLADGSLRFVLSVVLLVLAVIQTIKQSIGVFKATKKWQPNKYMQQLVTDGILYFLVYASLFYFILFPICSICFKCLHKN